MTNDDSSWWLLPREIDDAFAKAADQILEKRGAAKLKPPPEPPTPKGPESYEVAEPGDTLSIAFVKGFEAASAAAGMCCGCNTYSHGMINPYDGTEVQ